MVELLGGMSKRCDNGNKSSASCPPQRLVGADLGIDEMVEVGLFHSILPTIKYQLMKTNIVSSALSRSQRKDTKDSRDDSAASTIVAIEEEVMALSGVSMELSTEDLQG